MKLKIARHPDVRFSIGQRMWLRLSLSKGQSDHQVQGQVEEKIYVVSKDHDIVRSARSKNQEILDIIS